MAKQPRASSVFLFLLTILSSNVLAQYEHENVAPFSHRNIALRISLFPTFLYFVVILVYEILNHDQTVRIEGGILLTLGHIRFLSGALALALLMLILIPYFGWLLLVIWIMFFLKVAFYPGQKFYNFEMFNILKANNQNTVPEDKRGQEEQLPPV